MDDVFLTIEYGYINEDENEGIRELSYDDIETGCRVGKVRYDMKNGIIKGNVSDYKFQVRASDGSVIIDDDTYSYNAFFNKEQHRLKIRRNDGYEIEVSWKNLNICFKRLAFYEKNGKIYKINIARNQTPLDALKTILALLSLCLYTPIFEGVLPKECHELTEAEHTMLFHCSYLLQMYYFSFDYSMLRNWN